MTDPRLDLLNPGTPNLDNSSVLCDFLLTKEFSEFKFNFGFKPMSYLSKQVLFSLS